MINKDEFMNKIDEWYENDEHEKIIEAILALSDDELDDDILGQLAVAYNNTGEYKKAIAVLESQRPRLESWFKWQYRMGYALMNAADDEECEDDEELRFNILDRARVCFARCMNMNPPEDYLEECDMYIESIEARLNDGEEDEEPDGDPELYTDEEMTAVEEHIKEYFGDFPTVYHEVYSPDIHVDVCCVPPNEKRNYYTLITMGMGAHVMNVPEELQAQGLGRAELLICLPPDWKLGEPSDEWYWPLGLIKNLARLPINCDTWLGYAHSVDNLEPFAPNTALCGSLIIMPEDVDKEAEVCELPSGEKVHFFEVLPLYQTEMNFKIDHDAETLLAMMNGISHVTQIDRPNACPDYVLNEKPESLSTRYSESVIDNGAAHVASIDEKKLNVDRITGYNHLAIFLRWAIERKLTARDFNEHFSAEVQGVLDGTATDLREFVRDKLDGVLLTFFFSYEGFRFIKYYYTDGSDESVFFPCDVDRYAENYFGTERYNSEEFQDEAYLFVPFDEEYYKGLSAVIDKHFADFRAQDTYTADFAENVMRGLLGCRCTAYDSDSNEEIRQAFEQARLRGQEKGFTPLLVIYDADGEARRGEGLDELFDGLFFSAPITIAEVPVKSGAEVFGWFKSWFGAKELPAAKADISEFEQLYGSAPAVINCADSEPAPVMFLPEAGGKYSAIIADPALNETGEDDTRLKLCKDENSVDLLPAMVNYLGCRYTLFPPCENDSALMSAYAQARIRGAHEGFVPVILSIDKTLLENLIYVSNSTQDDAEFGFDIDKLSAYRSAMLSMPLPDGKRVLAEYIEQCRTDAEEADVDFDEEIVGEVTPNQPLTRFISYWNAEEKRTEPLILAEIPVNKPWQVFAYLPFGGWHECPNTTELMAAAKYWYKKYGAVPAAIGKDELEFFVDRPANADDALPLALEMYGFCPDLDQNSRIGELAGSLDGSTVWYFRWE